jgi:hypothetical protein
MQSARRNIKLQQRHCPNLAAFVQVKATAMACPPVRHERAQNGMLITWGNFTLRVRHRHQPAASYRQSPGVRELAR